MVALLRAPQRLFFACLALLLATPVLAGSSAYSGFVVFGTSLSDPGNAFALRGTLNTPPDYLLDMLLVPGAPYARGGHHLSNGAPWIVQLARPLGLAGSVQAAYRSSSAKATNYAVDGARAYDDGRNVNLTDQVSRFLLDFGGVAPADRLYAVELGSSDVRDALALYLMGGDGGTILQAGLTSIATNLQRLYAAGARHFLIVNVPDIALTPAVGIVDALFPGVGVKVLASSLVQTFNLGLESIAGGLPQDATVLRFDVFSTLYAIVADPDAYGLTNVVEPCLGGEAPPFTCRHPDDYLFWDGVHPTKAGHAVFAAEAREVLGE